MKIENISKKIKNYMILDNISLDIEENSTIALIGKNGSGKSTLIKIMSNLSLPTTGRIVNNLKNKDIGLMLEGGNFFFKNLTVYDNLIYFSGIKGVDKKNLHIFIKKYGSFFHIEKLLNKKINELSTGERQYVSILVATVNSPKILFLDEPSNGLDFENTKILVEFLVNYQSKNKISIIIVSHDINFLTKIANTFFFINNGKIIGIKKGNFSINEIEYFYSELLKGDCL